MDGFDWSKEKIKIRRLMNEKGEKHCAPIEALLTNLSSLGAHIESKGKRKFIPMWNILEIEYVNQENIKRVF